MTPDEAVRPAAHSPSALPVPEGLVLAPLRALRYATTGSDLARVISPPYDVIDEDERRALEASDPHNVVRLILPRDEEGHPGSGYRRAALSLAEWRATGVLVPDERPGLYVYEMDDGRRQTRGLIGALALVAPEAGIVLPHENTMAGTVADRLALTEATQANLEAIYLVYDGGGTTSQVVAAQQDRPIAETSTDDGITHRLWSITDRTTLAEIAEDLAPRRAVIADGHHRYATYLRHQADRHARGDGTGPWDYGLVLLVDATVHGPQVHPIHRVVPGLALPDAVERAHRGFTVTELHGGERAAVQALAAAGAGGTHDMHDMHDMHETDAGAAGGGAEAARAGAAAFVLTDAHRWYLLTEPNAERLAAALPADRSAAWRSLDVTVLHRFLIESLWGLRDHEDVVGFRHDTQAAVDAAAESGGTAVLLNPTSVEEVIAVAAAGERMPRKSTLFTPKPRTGFVIRAYSDSGESG